jgi:hypothetical protein
MGLDQTLLCRRTMRLLVCACALGFSAIVLAACDGQIVPEDDPNNPGGGDSGLLPDGARIDAGRDSGRLPPGRDAGKDASPHVDPVCPNPPPPIKDFECDVLAQTGCKPGEGCYPYVEYPGGYCEPERYGSACAPAGTGTQGTPCGDVTTCAPGFVCVITGAGTHCTKNCDLNKSGTCPEGLICQPLDVSGLGVCD